MRKERGITLIALVITIIILLILAGVAISSLTENGLFKKAKLAKEVQMQTEMREQLVLALSELQVEKEGDATLNDVTQEWADSVLKDYEPIITDDEEINGKIITMTQNGVVVNYIIDEKLNITEEIAGARLTYEIKSIDGKNIQVFVTITDNVNGLQKIEYSDGHIESPNGKKSASRDCTVQLGVEYKIKITSQDGTVKEETILLEEAKEIKITDKINVSLTQTAKIETTLNPSNAIAEIKWTIEDETIAEINDGEVKGLTAGTTTVTATIELQDGTTIQDTCEVNVYQKVTVINTAEELRAFAEEVNNGNSFEYELVKLGKDIDLSSVCYKVDGTTENDISWTPIGYYNSDTDYTSFKGTFNGDNKTISNLYINTTNDYQGLFGYIESSIIKSVIIDENSMIAAASSVGGICGGAKNTIISNCVNNGTINANGRLIGGIAGSGYGGIIEKCINNANITSTNTPIGGITSYLYNGIIKNCGNYGVLTCTSINSVESVSGIAWATGASTIQESFNKGNLESYAKNGSGNTNISGIGSTGGSTTPIIINCYNTGDIIGYYSQAGGITSSSSGTTKTTITNCYNVGNVTSAVTTGRVSGGIIGYMKNATITNCYNAGTIKASTTTASAAVGSSSLYVGYIIGWNNGGNGYSEYDNLSKTQLQGYASTLGTAFTADVKDEDGKWKYNQGYPILKWELDT